MSNGLNYDGYSRLATEDSNVKLFFFEYKTDPSKDTAHMDCISSAEKTGIAAAISNNDFFSLNKGYFESDVHYNKFVITFCYKGKQIDMSYDQFVLYNQCMNRLDNNNSSNYQLLSQYMTAIETGDSIINDPNFVNSVISALDNVSEQFEEIKNIECPYEFLAAAINEVNLLYRNCIDKIQYLNIELIDNASEIEQSITDTDVSLSNQINESNSSPVIDEHQEVIDSSDDLKITSKKENKNNFSGFTNNNNISNNNIDENIETEDVGIKKTLNNIDNYINNNNNVTYKSDEENLILDESSNEFYIMAFRYGYNNTPLDSLPKQYTESEYFMKIYNEGMKKRIFDME